MTWKQRKVSDVTVVILTAAVAIVGFSASAGAFGGHEQITRDAFADPANPRQFLRRGVLETINEQHAFMDRNWPTLRDPTPNRARINGTSTTASSTRPSTTSTAATTSCAPEWPRTRRSTRH